MYVCNCNAIRENDARKAIRSGARTAKAVFNYCGSQAKCAKCVCDIREMIDESDASLAMATE